MFCSTTTRTGPSKSKRSEKAERTSVDLSHGSIPDVAATLPVSTDSSDLRRDNHDYTNDNEEDDAIAESLARSHMMDSQAVHSFMLLDHNEELQVCS